MIDEIKKLMAEFDWTANFIYSKSDFSKNKYYCRENVTVDDLDNIIFWCNRLIHNEHKIVSKFILQKDNMPDAYGELMLNRYEIDYEEIQEINKNITIRLYCVPK